MPNCAQICLKWLKKLFLFSLRSREKEYMCFSKFWSSMGEQHVVAARWCNSQPHITCTGMRGALTAVYDSAVGGLREQWTVITLLFPSFTHTHTQTYNYNINVWQRWKEPKTSLQLESPDSSESREKRRGGERDVRREMREKRET